MKDTGSSYRSLPLKSVMLRLKEVVAKRYIQIIIQAMELFYIFYK